MTATPLTIYCGDARFLYQLLNTSPTILQDGAYCIKASTLCDEFIDCMDASDEVECGHCEKPQHQPCREAPHLCIGEVPGQSNCCYRTLSGKAL